MRKLKQKYSWKNREGLFAFRAATGIPFPVAEELRRGLYEKQVMSLKMIAGTVDFMSHLENAVWFGGKGKIVNKVDEYKLKYKKYENEKKANDYLESVAKTGIL